MTRPTTGLLHSAVMDAAHTQPAPDAIAAVRAKTPPDLRAVVGFEPLPRDGKSTGPPPARATPRAIPHQLNTHASGPPRNVVAGRSHTPQETHA